MATTRWGPESRAVRPGLWPNSMAGCLTALLTLAFCETRSLRTANSAAGDGHFLGKREPSPGFRQTRCCSGTFTASVRLSARQVGRLGSSFACLFLAPLNGAVGPDFSNACSAL